MQQHKLNNYVLTLKPTQPVGSPPKEQTALPRVTEVQEQQMAQKFRLTRMQMDHSSDPLNNHRTSRLTSSVNLSKYINLSKIADKGPV
jgi:hypothetical protein